MCRSLPGAHRLCGGSGPPGRTLRAKNASTSGLGSCGSAIRSSARSRFSRFWLMATTTVGRGGAYEWYGRPT